MAWVHRTMIVPVDLTTQAQELCGALAGDAGRGMFTAELSPTGNLPATHNISTGLIEDMFAGLLSDSAAIYHFATQMGIQVSENDIQNLLASCDVSQENPFTAMERLNLELISSVV